MRYFLIELTAGRISMTDSEQDASQWLRIADTVVIDAVLCDRITPGDRDPIPSLNRIYTGES